MDTTGIRLYGMHDSIGYSPLSNNVAARNVLEYGFNFMALIIVLLYYLYYCTEKATWMRY